MIFLAFRGLVWVGCLARLFGNLVGWLGWLGFALGFYDCFSFLYFWMVASYGEGSEIKYLFHPFSCAPAFGV